MEAEITEYEVLSLVGDPIDDGAIHAIACRACWNETPAWLGHPLGTARCHTCGIVFELTEGES